jgi:hypothetical protein
MPFKTLWYLGTKAGVRTLAWSAGPCISPQCPSAAMQSGTEGCSDQCLAYPGAGFSLVLLEDSDRCVGCWRGGG